MPFASCSPVWELQRLAFLYRSEPRPGGRVSHCRTRSLKFQSRELRSETEESRRRKGTPEVSMVFGKSRTKCSHFWLQNNMPGDQTMRTWAWKCLHGSSNSVAVLDTIRRYLHTGKCDVWEQLSKQRKTSLFGKCMLLLIFSFNLKNVQSHNAFSLINFSTEAWKMYEQDFTVVSNNTLCDICYKMNCRILNLQKCPQSRGGDVCNCVSWKNKKYAKMNQTAWKWKMLTVWLPYQLM